MKTIISFFKIWFSLIPECWNDAKIKNYNPFKESFKDFVDKDAEI
jgi:hypothetical protein